MTHTHDNGATTAATAAGAASASFSSLPWLGLLEDLPRMAGPLRWVWGGAAAASTAPPPDLMEATTAPTAAATTAVSTAELPPLRRLAGCEPLSPALLLQLACAARLQGTTTLPTPARLGLLLSVDRAALAWAVVLVRHGQNPSLFTPCPYLPLSNCHLPSSMPRFSLLP